MSFEVDPETEAEARAWCEAVLAEPDSVEQAARNYVRLEESGRCSRWGSMVLRGECTEPFDPRREYR